MSHFYIYIVGAIIYRRSFDDNKVLREQFYALTSC
jgi:hypothetical protein